MHLFKKVEYVRILLYSEEEQAIARGNMYRKYGEIVDM